VNIFLYTVGVRDTVTLRCYGYQCLRVLWEVRPEAEDRLELQAWVCLLCMVTAAVTFQTRG